MPQLFSRLGKDESLIGGIFTSGDIMSDLYACFKHVEACIRLYKRKLIFFLPHIVYNASGIPNKLKLVFTIYLFNKWSQTD